MSAVALTCLTLSSRVESDPGETKVPLGVLSDIRAAPELVKFGDSVLQLHANAWRNFMPLAGAEPGGRPMIVSLVVIVESGPPVALHVDAIWILQAEKVWQPHEIEEGSTDSRGATNEYMVRDGPTLSPGTFIDTVVRISNLKGKYYYLSARHQAIKFVS
jgi:hypothetical protein